MKTLDPDYLAPKQVKGSADFACACVCVKFRFRLISCACACVASEKQAIDVNQMQGDICKEINSDAHRF